MISGIAREPRKWPTVQQTLEASGRTEKEGGGPFLGTEGKQGQGLGEELGPGEPTGKTVSLEASRGGRCLGVSSQQWWVGEWVRTEQ